MLPKKILKLVELGGAEGGDVNVDFDIEISLFSRVLVGHSLALHDLDGAGLSSPFLNDLHLAVVKVNYLLGKAEDGLGKGRSTSSSEMVSSVLM